METVGGVLVFLCIVGVLIFSYTLLYRLELKREKEKQVRIEQFYLLSSQLVDNMNDIKEQLVYLNEFHYQLVMLNYMLSGEDDET